LYVIDRILSISLLISVVTRPEATYRVQLRSEHHFTRPAGSLRY
jgi:hypothetical protein